MLKITKIAAYGLTLCLFSCLKKAGGHSSAKESQVFSGPRLNLSNVNGILGSTLKEFAVLNTKRDMCTESTNSSGASLIPIFEYHVKDLGPNTPESKLYAFLCLYSSIKSPSNSSPQPEKSILFDGFGVSIGEFVYSQKPGNNLDFTFQWSSRNSADLKDFQPILFAASPQSSNAEYSDFLAQKTKIFEVFQIETDRLMLLAKHPKVWSEPGAATDALVVARKLAKLPATESWHVYSSIKALEASTKTIAPENGAAAPLVGDASRLASDKFESYLNEEVSMTNTQGSYSSWEVRLMPNSSFKPIDVVALPMIPEILKNLK